MIRVLLGSFYTLQGIGNPALVYLVLAVTRNPFAIFLGVLLVPSILSLLTVWNLYRKNVDPTSAFGKGMVASVLFCVFYWAVIGMHASSIWLLLYLEIVALNVVLIFGLYSFWFHPDPRVFVFWDEDLSEKAEMSGRVARGYMGVFTGLALCVVGIVGHVGVNFYMKYTLYSTYSDLVLIWRDWGVPISLIGIALMAIGVALGWSDIKTS